MRIKRIGIALCAMMIILLAGCVREADGIKTVHDGANANAVILNIDAERNEAVVKYVDDEKSCMLDCAGASVVYCDYATGEVWKLSLVDLAEGDLVIIQTDTSESQNAKAGRAKATQIQLSTQRLEK